MPPAFVLSQDQTLMFNPDIQPRHPATQQNYQTATQPDQISTGPPPAQRSEPKKGLTTLTPDRHSFSATPAPRERTTTLAAARASLPLTNNVNQQNRFGANPVGARPAREAAYRPIRRPRSMDFRRKNRGHATVAGSAGQTAAAP